MAVHPKLNVFADGNAPNTSVTQPINIEAWTEQAIESLQATSLSSPGGIRGTSVSLAIPLDEHPVYSRTKSCVDAQRAEDASGLDPPRRLPIRRDSMKRREALLKGKEGTRQRRRWENDRLLNNPWAQPPLPSDWEVHPTYPKRTVPYYLAPLWDTEKALRNSKPKQNRGMLDNSIQGEQKLGQISRELREKLKRAKAAKGLLQDLEEEVRKFVKNWEEKEKKLEKDGLRDMDSEDEEIVFVGRNGQMHDMPTSSQSKKAAEEENIKRDKLLFDSLADDHGASFGRWLVHSIATYYDLRTWSITVGDPARREAYVGIKRMKAAERPISSLPRPLWGLI